MRIASGGFHGKHPTGNVEERNIESATPEIENENVLLLFSLLIKSVRDGRSGGLIDDAKNIKPRDSAGVLGCETLRVVEVSWNTVLTL